MNITAIAEKYYFNGFNCAETVYLAACEHFGLETSEEVKLLAGFGGGMTVGSVCGALTGGIAFLGRLMVTTKAHETEELAPAVQKLIAAFTELAQTTQCSILKERVATEDRRCFRAVEMGLEALLLTLGE